MGSGHSRDSPRVGIDEEVVALGQDAQSIFVRPRFIPAHGLAAHALHLVAETHALAEAAQALRDIAVTAADRTAATPV